MNAYEFLRWGEQHHYPQLVLGDDDGVLPSGRHVYYGIVESDDTVRLERAIARAEQWNARIAQERSKSICLPVNG